MATGEFSLVDFTPEGISSLFKTLLDEPSSEIFRGIHLNGLAKIEVYIPDRNLSSEITPPYMEAFLELQKQLIQFAAYAKTGVANGNQLDDSERAELEISVKVTGGSSNYLTDISENLEEIAKAMIKKLDGKQVVIVVLGVAALVASTWSFEIGRAHV